MEGAPTLHHATRPRNEVVAALIRRVHEEPVQLPPVADCHGAGAGMTVRQRSADHAAGIHAVTQEGEPDQRVGHLFARSEVCRPGRPMQRQLIRHQPQTLTQFARWYVRLHSASEHTFNPARLNLPAVPVDVIGDGGACFSDDRRRRSAHSRAGGRAAPAGFGLLNLRGERPFDAR